MKFLYIEDERNDIDLMNRYFETVEHELIIATSLGEVWDKLDSSVDLIMIDIFLHGEKSGYELAHQLRSKSYNQPLIAITALTTTRDIEDIREADFDVVIHKPFTIRELEKTLQQYVF